MKSAQKLTFLHNNSKSESWKGLNIKFNVVIIKMAILNNSDFVTLSRVEGLLEEQQACAINSIILLIKSLFPKTTVTIEELKKILDFDDEGISIESYLFNKLNQRLSKEKCTFKLYKSKFSAVEDLIYQLSLRVPVPVYMKMEVIERFKSKFDHPNKKFNWGNTADLFKTSNIHVLLFVGYEENGEKLYFIDPCYQLPYLSGQSLNTKKVMLSLNQREFYQYAKFLNIFIEVRYLKRLEKRLLAENKKDKQEKLKI